MKRSGADQNDADHDALQRRINAEQYHARLQRLHEHGAEHRSGYGTDAA
jgi:hypothetical protein